MVKVEHKLAERQGVAIDDVNLVRRGVSVAGGETR